MTRVVLVCGVGGAGKTTASAAIAVAAALRGERAVVLTIDPAKRLADALGTTLGDEPRRVALDAPGTLDALMLDRKATFDQLVRDQAPDDATAGRLLSNRYYQAVSTRLTGLHEYMATEKLHQLVSAGRWDVVVVDTPPTQHAIDFLSAPERVQRLFDRGVLNVLTQRRGIFGAASRALARVLERIAGDAVLADITEFFALIGSVSDAIRERQMRVHDLLRSDRSRFVLVSAPRGEAEADLRAFAEILRERDMKLGAFVANRVVLPPTVVAVDPDRLPELPDAMRDALLALPRQIDALSRRHAALVSRLSSAAGGPPTAVLPDVAGGVRSLDALAGLKPYLPDL